VGSRVRERAPELLPTCLEEDPPSGGKESRKENQREEADLGRGGEREMNKNANVKGKANLICIEKKIPI